MGDAAAGDGSVAASEEMLLAVERWAVAKGWTGVRGWHLESPTGWGLYLPGDGAIVVELGVGGKGGRWRPSPEVAVAWALAVEAGLPAVDVGPCQACVARSLPGRKLATHVWMRDIDTPLKIGPGRGWVPGVRPCPDCNGAGRDIRDPARLVLDAAPRPVTPADVWLRAAVAEAAEPPRSGRTTRMLDAAARHVLEWGTDVIVGAAVGDAQRLQSLANQRDRRITVLSMPTVARGLSNRKPGDIYVLVDHWAFERLPLGEIQRTAEAIARVNRIEPGRDPGDRKAIEALTPLADHLQPHAFDTRKPDPAREAAGHALAHLVALWLDGDLRETRTSVEALTAVWERLTVPCDLCEATGELTMRHKVATGAQGRGMATLYARLCECPTCRGYGRAMAAVVLDRPARGPVD